jgi:hypothetical protein
MEAVQIIRLKLWDQWTEGMGCWNGAMGSFYISCEITGQK